MIDAIIDNAHGDLSAISLERLDSMRASLAREMVYGETPCEIEYEIINDEIFSRCER